MPQLKYSEFANQLYDLNYTIEQANHPQHVLAPAIQIVPTGQIKDRYGDFGLDTIIEISQAAPKEIWTNPDPLIPQKYYNLERLYQLAHDYAATPIEFRYANDAQGQAICPFCHSWHDNQPGFNDDDWVTVDTYPHRHDGYRAKAPLLPAEGGYEYTDQSVYLAEDDHQQTYLMLNHPYAAESSRFINACPICGRALNQ